MDRFLTGLKEFLTCFKRMDGFRRADECVNLSNPVEVLSDQIPAYFQNIRGTVFGYNCENIWIFIPFDRGGMRIG